MGWIPVNWHDVLLERIANSKMQVVLTELPNSYKDIVLAMHIGNIFRSSDHVYSYSTMGLGRLLYNIPYLFLDLNLPYKSPD